MERDRVGEDRAPDFNVTPTRAVQAVLERAAAPEPSPAGPGTEGGGKGQPGRELRLLRWGLVPSWAKDARGGARLINARAETVAVKPSFRNAFTRRRCLIPADGYYEWMASPDKSTPKQPFYIHRADGGIIPFAGIYELWRDEPASDGEEGGWLWTASIITTSAPDEIGQIHDRTPMVIAPQRWDEWLDPANSDREMLLAAMAPATAAGDGGLASYPVSTAVNSVRNNGPGLIEPAAAGLSPRLPIPVAAGAAPSEGRAGGDRSGPQEPSLF